MWHQESDAVTDAGLLAKAMIDRFGERAAGIATQQACAADGAGGSMPQTWLAIAQSINRQLDQCTGSEASTSKSKAATG